MIAFKHNYNYADDNSLVSSGYDYAETQQNLLKNVKKVMTWFEENHMRVNPEKFNYIVFGKNTDVTGIMLDNYLIEPVNKITRKKVFRKTNSCVYK